MGKVLSTCVFCDGGCGVVSQRDGDEVTLSPANPDNPAMCSKAVRWREIRDHEGRVLSPLQNIGRRGDPVWRPVSWDFALDEIAARLKDVVDRYGARALGVSEMPLNHGFGGITRRFMNHLGSPNYITALDLCMGNTAQVHRATYGWFTTPRWEITDCVVYFGQNRGPELWPVEFGKLKAALRRGALLIVVDPRITETAKMADYHLRINYGTDAALALSWINVILEEGLFDAAFVEENTIGFDELAQRVREYDPDTVSEICGVEADLIRMTARAYAAAQAAIIPWGATGDMQRNSTSLLRSQCILRSICGFVNKSEMVFGPSSNVLTNAQLADYDALPQHARDCQLGADDYPLLSFRTAPLYASRLREAGFDFMADIMASSCMAHPPTLFAAMRGEGPYPVKAFFSIANNTVMSYANMRGIADALMNQDLVVVFEVNMTPTAQFADFILPGDMWMERNIVGPPFDSAPIVTTSCKFIDAPELCHDWYFVVKGLADRLGMSDVFPWADSQELCEYRLAAVDTCWADAVGKGPIAGQASALGSFLTPSGKIELVSSVLEALGCDPLPYYRPLLEPACQDQRDYPFELFAGGREPASYNTNYHQIDFLRKRAPQPMVYLHTIDARAIGACAGDWVRVSTHYGSVDLQVLIDEAQKPGTLRVPHGWWKPETPLGLADDLGCSLLHNDGVLFPDDPWNLDPEQGLPNLRGGIRAKVELL